MWISTLTAVLAPVFIILSPILSYTDQAVSMHRNKSSAGFSLDIPLIMLVASMLKVFYWPGARFDNALLVQALIMIVMQTILLKIALDHRPSPASKGGEAAIPFSGVVNEDPWGSKRPFNFWQWRSPRPYWQFVVYFFLALTALELLLSLIPAVYHVYSDTIGYMGLSIEAFLPIPQILINARSRSSHGFRLSLLGSWLIGDALKMLWFFTTTTEIPAAFKLCGIFQACCDSFLGIQYWMYGDGSGNSVKEHPMIQLHDSPYKPSAHESDR
ncbi:PQ loop repeat protein [Sodiomyces alkalinus F11]|uniref:PQ loop repeat protein n=1 Tax=Sodiomyces alkalinus (strain CBS 110278 / VKM F-3762 / F11) TaxID=1314773 RepID=A0A3N2PX71_SODAK|nr:PQ loop repeat protein [Sodiomyces alkalinus F11]ROT39129.1 PQ loop repeat protein [Sodiomyces alkalinus F11]